MATSYLLGCIPLGCALIVLGFFSIGPLTSAAIKEWIRPVVINPYSWLVVWFLVVTWLGGPRFVRKMRIAWHKGGFRPRIVFNHAALERNKWDHNIYTHLWFRNEPAGASALDVRAEIIWTPKDKMDQELFSDDAKWAATPWNFGKLIRKANRIDFPNDGTSRALDLCVRKPNIADFYELDIESPNRGAFQPDRLLQPGFYDVYVTLSCDCYIVHFRFEVEVQAGTDMPQT